MNEFQMQSVVLTTYFKPNRAANSMHIWLRKGMLLKVGNVGNVCVRVYI